MTDSLARIIDPALSDCGCCEGTTVETPLAVSNRPGLSAIAYRVGTHARFKRTMLTRLFTSGQGALRDLRTRDDDDFSIALLDAWATVADVLTFYQERIANESYLRTATERFSVLQLARTIGYELRPGVAASTVLAFTLESAPGAPSVVPLDIGTKVQSIPGPGERPQIFETVAKIDAHVEWNALRPQRTTPQQIGLGTTELFLKGTTTQLQPGDALLFVGDEREFADLTSDNWDFRTIDTVVAYPAGGYTRVTWQEGLGHNYRGSITQPAKYPRIFALRQRAALFGHNAPDWRSMAEDVRKRYHDPPGTGDEWPDFVQKAADVTAKQIHLDGNLPKILNGSWIVLIESDNVEAYKVLSATSSSQTGFALASKTTRLALDANENLGSFRLRDTVVYAQSDLLERAEQPVIQTIQTSTAVIEMPKPLQGGTIVLDRLVSGLAQGHTVIVTGKRIRATVVAPAGLTLTLDDGTTHAVNAGDSLQVLAPYTASADRRTRTWHLRDDAGVTGTVATAAENILLTPARDEDETISEVATIETVSADVTPTTLTLHALLRYSYDRATVAIDANVVAATHGEGKQDVLGSGDGAQAYQHFPLRQAPLTYVSGTDATGAVSTLGIFVNDVLWHEVPSFYGHGPNERIYVTRQGDNGKTTVIFGDGRTGARLPSGQENIRAVYRKGIGTAGLVAAGQLSLLMSRPLGVKGVVNPQAATGADDPETRDDARTNATLTIRSLERVVSLEDYEDFARAFAGVAKALATWTWTGQQRGVFLTVAGPKGAAITPDSDPYKHLLLAMQQGGDPYVPLAVQTYAPAFFTLSARIERDPDREEKRVLAAVEAALRAAFSFDARTLGQGVTLSEVIALIQGVPGVVAVTIDQMFRTDTAPHPPPPFLRAAFPQAGGRAHISAAELLTLDPRPLNLGVMT